MKYRSFYSNALFISSLFYFTFAMMDFFITMKGYAKYDNLFFHFELNPTINFLLKHEIPPIHMFILPLVLVFLCVYFKILVDELNTKSIVKDKIIWGIGLSTCLMVGLGIIHLIGFISWFYHGGF